MPQISGCAEPLSDYRISMCSEKNAESIVRACRRCRVMCERARWRARIAALPSRFSLFAASVRMTVFSKKIGKNHVYSYTCEVLDGVGRILTSDLPYPRLLSHTVIPKKEANSRRGEALRSLYYPSMVRALN